MEISTRWIVGGTMAGWDGILMRRHLEILRSICGGRRSWFSVYWRRIVGQFDAINGGNILIDGWCSSENRR